MAFWKLTWDDPSTTDAVTAVITDAGPCCGACLAPLPNFVPGQPCSSCQCIVTKLEPLDTQHDSAHLPEQ